MPDLQVLIDRVVASYTDLSPQLRKAAQFVIDHPTEVALNSMRTVAGNADVPPSTLVRLARALGFDSYDDLREPFRQTVRRQRIGYSDRAEVLQAGAERAGLHANISAAQAKNLQLVFDANEDSALRAAGQALVRARRVGVVGGLASFGIAQYVAYIGRLALPSMVLLHGPDGPAVDILSTLDRRDLVLAISLAPYANDSVRTVHRAAAQGAEVIALTDSALSPLARGASHVLSVPTRSPHFFPSYVPALALLEALLAHAVSRGGDKLLANIRHSEEVRQELGVYWAEE